MAVTELIAFKPGVDYVVEMNGTVREKAIDDEFHDSAEGANVATAVLTREELSREVARYARELADMVAPAIQLKYPWVLVRVLPREQKVGSIIVPGAAQGIGQNKPVHEGIVLHTWKPWTKHWTKNGGAYSHHMTPSVKVGDHVLFNHWAGQELFGFDRQEFRVVRSDDWSESTTGGIIATVDYEDKPDVLADMIEEWIKGFMTVSTELADSIRERYQLVDKTKTSITLSGV